ncbi:hypothetical protein [Williamsia deligens]|uniref:Uncharacterized protein n=1 Tax=Williamsia deligens TaxID=321325 RepID=A0ABW3GDN5_9NOCA|nr:hypothetical protein [Williamsia deligens]MCP2195879.1 hypothetical protein [Williamsia deligens]
MLVSALGATLVGFALLVLALATGALWLAVACIAICVLGAVLLLADTLGFRPTRRRRGRPGVAAGSTGDEAVADDAPTEQFDRVVDDPVALSDPPPAHHGRHERPDAPADATAEADADALSDPAPPHRSRHGVDRSGEERPEHD